MNLNKHNYIFKNKLKLSYEYNVLYECEISNLKTEKNFLTMVYIRTGICEISVKNDNYALQPGDIITLPGETECDFNIKNKRTGIFVLSFDISIFSYTDITPSVFYNICTYTAPELDIYFDNIGDEFTVKPYAWQTKIMSSIFNILAILAREKNVLIDYNSFAKSDIVEQITKIIAKNYNKQISTSTIANAMNFSSSYICHIFKDTTGKSITSFLNEVRCKNAENMLRSGNLTVSEVAEQCGFNNPSYFSKIYKKTTGRNPSDDILK